MHPDRRYSVPFLSGQTEPGTTAVTLTRDETTVVICDGPTRSPLACSSKICYTFPKSWQRSSLVRTCTVNTFLHSNPTHLPVSPLPCCKPKRVSQMSQRSQSSIHHPIGWNATKKIRSQMSQSLQHCLSGCKARENSLSQMSLLSTKIENNFTSILPSFNKKITFLTCLK